MLKITNNLSPMINLNCFNISEICKSGGQEYKTFCKEQHDFLLNATKKIFEPYLAQMIPGFYSEFGDYLYKILGDINSQRRSIEVPPDKLKNAKEIVVHKKFGLTPLKGTNAVYMSPHILFSHLTAEHISLIISTKKRQAANEFLQFRQQILNYPSIIRIPNKLKFQGLNFQTVHLTDMYNGVDNPLQNIYSWQNRYDYTILNKIKDIEIEEFIIVLPHSCTINSHNKSFQASSIYPDNEFCITILPVRKKTDILVDYGGMSMTYIDSPQFSVETPLIVQGSPHHGRINANKRFDPYEYVQKNIGNEIKFSGYIFVEWDKILDTGIFQKEIDKYCNFLKTANDAWRYLKQKYCGLMMAHSEEW